VRLTASSATQLSRRLANRLREIDETLFDVEIDGLEGELGLRLEADARQVDGGFEWRPSLAGSVRRGSIQTPRLPYPLRDVDARFALTADGIVLSRLWFAFGQGWGELAARMPGWDVENAVIEGSV